MSTMTILEMCPTIASTKVMNITCYFNIRKLKNCAEPVVGTIAKYHCAPFYEDVKLMEHSLYCNGSWGNASWTPGTPYCVPSTTLLSISAILSV